MTQENNNNTIDQDVQPKNAGIQSILQLLGTDGIRTLIEAFNGGASGASIMQSFLQQTQLSPEQQPLVELINLLAADSDAQGHLIEGEIQSDDLEEDEEDDYDDYEVPEPAPGKRSNVYDIRRFRRELRDLRNVNDTVAAALGACPVCWGGDSQCHSCGGEGSSGAYQPDVHLFNELVAPAVRRIRSMKRTRQRHLVRELR